MTTSKEEPELVKGKLSLPNGREIEIDNSTAILIIHGNGDLDVFSPKWVPETGAPDDWLPQQVQALFFVVMLLTQEQFAALPIQLDSMVKSFYKYYKDKEGNVQHAVH